MTRSMIVGIACLLACAAAPAAKAAPMAGMAMATLAPKTGTAVGVVTAVDAKAGTVTIRHQPIPAIGWPAMTMTFNASTAAVLRAAKVGRPIRFGVRVDGPRAQVTSIKPE